MVKLTGQPAIASFFGQLYLFVMGVDDAVHYISQTAPSNGWTGWTSLGAPANIPFVGSPAAFDSQDEVNLACRAVGNDGALFQRDQGPQWGLWFSQGTPPGRVLSGSPVIEGRNTFVVDTQGAIWAFNDTGIGAKWSTLGAPPGGAVTTGTPAVAPSADGRLELFVVGTNGNLYHTWQTNPNKTWANWFSHGGTFTGNPAIAPSADGRLELFVVGTDGNLYHIWQTASSNGWSNFYSHGGTFTGTPALGASADGRLELFVVGTDGALHHIWQRALNNGWSGFFSHAGGPFAGPAVLAPSADGRLELFVAGTDGNLYHIWQTALNNGWSGWYSHGSA